MKQRGVLRKGRAVTDRRRLRDLILEYVDIWEKDRAMARDREIDAEVIHAVASGPAFESEDNRRPSLMNIYEKWELATRDLKIKAHHQIYTLPPSAFEHTPQGATGRYMVAFALSAIRGFQSWARPDAELSLLAGFHQDEAHPHSHVLIMPTDSEGRRLNFSRLAAAVQGDDVIRIDFQGRLVKAYNDYLRHFENPEDLHAKNPSLAIITPKLSYDDWLCALHATFAMGGAEKVSSEELLARFGATRASFRHRLKAADELEAEQKSIAKDVRDSEAAKYIQQTVADRISASKSNRDRAVESTGAMRAPALVDVPTSERKPRKPDEMLERLQSIRRARIENDVHRLRMVYANLRIYQLAAPNRALRLNPSRDLPGNEGDPIERTLNLCMARMQQLTDERRRMDLKLDGNVAQAPYDLDRSEDATPDMAAPEPADSFIPAPEPPPMVRLPSIQLEAAYPEKRREKQLLKEMSMER